MFALRDHIFANHPQPDGPSRSALPSPPPEATYRDGVARVCDQIAKNERDNAEKLRGFKSQLPTFRTGYEQRNELLYVVHSAAARSQRALSTFKGLDVYPSSLDPIAEGVVRPWRRSVKRLQTHADNLRTARSFGDLAQAASRYGNDLAEMQDDAARVLTRLRQLTDKRCELPPAPEVEPVQLLGPRISGSGTAPRPLSPAVRRAPLSHHVNPKLPLPVAVSPAPSLRPGSSPLGPGGAGNGNTDDPSTDGGQDPSGTDGGQDPRPRGNQAAAM